MSIINSATTTKAHIASGMVLAAFILGHFTNHALGLVSIDAMESTRVVLSAVWRQYCIVCDFLL